MRAPLSLFHREQITRENTTQHLMPIWERPCGDAVCRSYTRFLALCHRRVELDPSATATKRQLRRHLMRLVLPAYRAGGVAHISDAEGGRVRRRRKFY